MLHESIIKYMSSPASLREGVDQRGLHVMRYSGGGRAVQLEDALDDRDLRGRGVEAAEGAPVVDHHARAQHVAAAVYSAGHERHLEQRRQLLQILNGCPGMHHAALIREFTIASYQGVPCNCLLEHLHAEDIRYNILCLSVDVGMDEGDMVIADDAVAERRESLLDALQHHTVG